MDVDDASVQAVILTGVMVFGEKMAPPYRLRGNAVVEDHAELPVEVEGNVVTEVPRAAENQHCSGFGIGFHYDCVVQSP